jgi:pyruvate-formate lyase-activating enzyme
VQCSQLLSIKTGGCPEDCGYCSQSAHAHTAVERKPLMELDEVLAQARAARDSGADRFCMGAAWREVRDGEEFERVCEMVAGVKALGLETCVTLGMLAPHQAERLKASGLDYYNHNLDTGRSHYAEIVGTHGYDDRLATLAAVRDAGLHVCCGGILGMGESRTARAELLAQLAALDPQPESVPINTLVAVPGTPLEGTAAAGLDRGRRHGRGRAPAHAARDGAPVGRAPRALRGRAGAVLPGRRELDLLRRHAAHHAQPRAADRRGAAREAGAADGQPGRAVSCRSWSASGGRWIRTTSQTMS